MIGFVTTEDKARAANDAAAKAQTDRGQNVFWIPGLYQIFSGRYDGSYFVPCDDAIMNTPLIGSPPAKPLDFPEFTEIIESLGGLDGRVEINESDIVNPDEHSY